MKKIFIITLIILNILAYIPTIAQSKKLILDGMTIVIDPGHGGKDIGTSYGDIYEKDINLSISLYLERELEKYGANIILTREGDYDLSTPNALLRKKSDFNNRIKLINESNANLIISIHQNYYKDSKYSGTQIFYKDNKGLAEFLQTNLNNERLVKPINNDLYMYKKINTEILLIECGFLSNKEDRINLSNDKYQQEYSKKLTNYIIEFYKTNNILVK